MEFYNYEALSIIYFIRNRSVNIVNLDDKIYHKLLGRTFDALLHFPFHSHYFSNGDLLNFYDLKLKEFFTNEDIRELKVLIDEFRFSRDENLDSYLLSIGRKFIIYLQRKVIENELVHMLKLLSFYHYAFAFMYSLYPNDTKERNFILCMIQPFKFLLGKMRFMELQLWNINLCCKNRHICNYKMTWKEKLHFKINFNRSSDFILIRYVFYFRFLWMI